MTMSPRLRRFLLLACVLSGLAVARTPGASPTPASWTADNGNGTFTNPLFYDEFSDPDLIRVGEDFYLAGTTMHAMPGLVVLHSRDLVNWRFLSYAFQQLDLGPEFRLEEGKEAYGQGIWAPCIRYHNGRFYLFSNVNGHGMQVFSSANPAGPWEHRNLGGRIYDLSVLFDDDGRVYAVHGYDEVRMIELKPDLSGYVEGSDRVVIPRGNGMGEGHHFYKVDGRYYIISANYAPVGRMQCARADRPEGPYETVVISARETMGTSRGWWVRGVGQASKVPTDAERFELYKPGANEFGAVPLHQGGIVDLPNGDWWGFSMMDFGSIGRTTFLSPVTWKDGWPYFGLEGNLGRSPTTWIKPAVASATAPHAPYERSDAFEGGTLKPVWQWNHAPVAGNWSLAEAPGRLRLHTLPAGHFLWAKNTLTQRVIGPASSATVELDLTGLAEGDIAGLALLNVPCSWVGVVRTKDGMVLRWYNQTDQETQDQPFSGERVHLRATGNFSEDLAQYSFSRDGAHFEAVGDAVRLPYQLKTFQGSRYSLFAYNSAGRAGGHADFDNFTVVEPLADRSGNVPLNRVITLTNMGSGRPVWIHPLGLLHSAAPDAPEAESPAARFRVHDRGQGRVVLEALNGTGFVTVVGVGLSADVRVLPKESEASLFQWQDLLRNQCMLLSLKTHRYVGLDPATGEPYGADWPGPRPDRKDGTVLRWTEVGK